MTTTVATNRPAYYAWEIRTLIFLITFSSGWYATQRPIHALVWSACLLPIWGYITPSNRLINCINKAPGSLSRPLAWLVSYSLRAGINFVQLGCVHIGFLFPGKSTSLSHTLAWRCLQENRRACLAADVFVCATATLATYALCGSDAAIGTAYVTAVPCFLPFLARFYTELSGSPYLEMTRKAILWGLARAERRRTGYSCRAEQHFHAHSGD